MNKLCLTFAVMLALLDSGLGQPASATRLNNSRRWHVYTSPDKSFKISTPIRLRRFKDPEIKWAVFYAQDRLADECKQPLYAVIVADWRGDEKDYEGGAWDLFFLIGGSHADPTSETKITVHGFEGKEYFYSRPLESGCKYRRGRTINGGQLAFIVIFGSNQRRDLTSASTLRFFNSFRPQIRRSSAK